MQNANNSILTDFFLNKNMKSAIFLFYIEKNEFVIKKMITNVMIKPDNKCNDLVRKQID